MKLHQMAHQHEDCACAHKSYMSSTFASQVVGKRDSLIRPHSEEEATLRWNDLCVTLVRSRRDTATVNYSRVRHNNVGVQCLVSQFVLHNLYTSTSIPKMVRN